MNEKFLMTKILVIFFLSFFVFWTSILEATGFAEAARFIQITNTVAPSQIRHITFAVAVTLVKNYTSLSFYISIKKTEPYF